MHINLKNLGKQMLKRFDVGITSHARLQQLEKSSRASHALEVLIELPEEHKSRLLIASQRSQSQLGQDLFVLSELEFKTSGFFVEFGATNGVFLSNTWQLEKDFGWRGIVAEPARSWHKELKSNRNCHIETDCVWRESDSQLTFCETDSWENSMIDSRNLSGGNDHGKKYRVKTISLEDMLDKFNAPREIDYLSIDTEGSEYEILSSFNFDKYRFRTITCEHNYQPQREKIFSLLTGKGYARKHENVTYCDDWYVSAG